MSIYKSVPFVLGSVPLGERIGRQKCHWSPERLTVCFVPNGHFLDSPCEPVFFNANGESLNKNLTTLAPHLLSCRISCHLLVYMRPLQALSRLALVALCGIAAKAEWIVDERCSNLTHRALLLQQGDESPPSEVHWQMQAPPENNAILPTLQRDTRNLRGGGESRRQLQQLFAFRLKMFWREGYCVSHS